MLLADGWKDYTVIATGDGYKLEKWADYILLRPDPQVIWPSDTDMKNYPGLTAYYTRSSTGGGSWTYLRPMPESFTVGYGNLKFKLKLMGFKHTGLFPEQAVNWDRMDGIIRAAGRPVEVLNLKPVRYIIDDCIKFCRREIKRGKKYDAVIMDPPSFGRGPGGETWKIENDLFGLVRLTAGLLSDNPLFVLINGYTTGLQPSVMSNIIRLALGRDCKVEADEIGLPTLQSGIVLPAGASAFATF